MYMYFVITGIIILLLYLLKLKILIYQLSILIH